MVIDDFHIISVASRHRKTTRHCWLILMLYCPSEHLEGFPIGLRVHSKRMEETAGQHIEFAQGHTFDCFETATFACPFQRFGIAASISRIIVSPRFPSATISSSVKRKAFTCSIIAQFTAFKKPCVLGALAVPKNRAVPSPQSPRLCVKNDRHGSMDIPNGGIS